MAETTETSSPPQASQPPTPASQLPQPPPPPRTFRPAVPPPPPAVPRPPQRRSANPARRDDPPPAPIDPAKPASRWRELAQDPEERAEQRKSVSGEAASLIAMLDGIAQQLPPGTPLAPWEQEAIRTPLEEVIYKYGMNVDPAVTLLITLGGLALMRWQAAKEIEAKRATEAGAVGKKIAA